jgi:superfamily II DNA or RNA helicase
MLETWIEKFRSQAEEALRLGFVREVIFSGATYQVDVYDPQTDENYWPFLQFDDQGRVKDAFCSCSAENIKCYHLAAAYLRIVDSNGHPLHFLFEKSFWHHICQLCADHSGYEERYLKKIAEGHYLYQNEFFFEIKTKNEMAQRTLHRLIEERSKENPENSIKFSNLSQDEINRWREGRPSPYLRYALSIWSDLAKWMMAHGKEGHVLFDEDMEGFPTRLFLEFPFLSLALEIQKKDLKKLIPFLDSVNSNLKLFPSAEEKIISVTFNPQERAFYIQHQSLNLSDQPDQKLMIDGWAYLPKIGFYPVVDQPLLLRQRIDKDSFAEFLEKHAHQISPFIPVHETRQSLRYEIYFDENWNWNFIAYLFEKGDLERRDSLLQNDWAYIQEKGFYRVEKPLFNQVKTLLPPEEVSNFVNHHRIWLNTQEGFQTHLASIESQVIYYLSKERRLYFQSKAETWAESAKDFGDWVFYRGQGFFSKKHTRLGWNVRPGLVIEPHEISSFIRGNREELEHIPHFFTPLLPLISRTLEVTPHSSTSIQVKPLYTLLPEFETTEILLFGDYVYVKGGGFCELPSSMRLPEGYVKPKIIPQNALHTFIETELPLLRSHISQLDLSLIPPHKWDLSLHYLAHIRGGGMRAQLFYHTELGEVAVTDLLEALEHKRRYFFSPAGLIDLHSEPFQWLRQHKMRFSPEGKTIDLSTMELIRLDLTHGLLGPTETTPTAAITQRLLNELREFRSDTLPMTKGLKSELRLYQQTGLLWLWFLYKQGLSGLLCDDMGLGKTHQAMALIAAILNDGSSENRRFLIISPTSVIYHWQDKLQQFLPQLPVHTFHGLRRSLKPIPQEGVLLTSYGILRMEQKALETIPFELAIFDELQVAKNPKSRVHGALKKIQARMRIGLTGTPIENSLQELKALFDIVLPGYMPSENRYRDLFIQPIERDQDEEKKALLTKMIRPFVLRRKKREVLKELPEKTEDKFYCDLSDEQIVLYKQILAQSQKKLVAELHDQQIPVDYIHIFSLLSRLKQVCNHPALVHKDPNNFKNYRSGKWDLCVELMQEARESEQKIVIFSQYLYMLDIIENYLKEIGWEYAQIRGDTIDRREELRRFQEDPNCVVFIGSLQAAGLGIDLTAASVVILYDRWWNAARENQAIDRVHRIGQKWGVQVYKLITKNTIEEKIDLMILRKGRLLEEVIIPDDQAMIKNFTRSELIELLSFQD